MSALFELLERPDLESPVLLLALDGWIDAGLGASTALSTILETTDTATVATFDTDALLDHRARRPTMHLVDGVNTGLTWPALELRAADSRLPADRHRARLAARLDPAARQAGPALAPVGERLAGVLERRAGERLREALLVEPGRGGRGAHAVDGSAARPRRR